MSECCCVVIASWVLQLVPRSLEGPMIGSSRDVDGNRMGCVVVFSCRFFWHFALVGVPEYRIQIGMANQID